MTHEGHAGDGLGDGLGEGGGGGGGEEEEAGPPFVRFHAPVATSESKDSRLKVNIQDGLEASDDKAIGDDVVDDESRYEACICHEVPGPKPCHLILILILLIVGPYEIPSHSPASQSSPRSTRRRTRSPLRRATGIILERYPPPHYHS